VVGGERGQEYGILFAPGDGHTAMTTTRQPKTHSCREKIQKNSVLSVSLVCSKNEFARLIFANRHRVVIL